MTNYQRKITALLISITILASHHRCFVSADTFLASPGYSELGYSYKKKSAKKKLRFFHWAAPLAAVAITLFWTPNNEKNLPEIPFDQNIPSVPQFEIPVNQNIPSVPQFEIPSGFFDPESDKLPDVIKTAGQKAYCSSARILAFKKTEDGKDIAFSGSGICVSPDGHIMTAYHLIEEYLSDEAYSIVVEIPVVENSVRRFITYSNMHIVKDLCDKELDIGILKISANRTFSYIKPESFVPVPGNVIVKAGHPGGAQPCFISAGVIQKPSSDYEPYQFRHNAVAVKGSSGEGILLIDSDKKIHLVGITSEGANSKINLLFNEHIRRFERFHKAAIITVKILLENSKRKIQQKKLIKIPPDDILEFDLVNIFNPNSGKPSVQGFAINLSKYLSRHKSFQSLLPGTASEAIPFPGPTFLLTRSLSFTYERDNDVDMINRIIIAAGVRLAGAFKEFGITHIHITDHKSIEDGILSLSYETRNPLGTINNMLEIERKRQEISDYCLQYGFSLDIDEEYIPMNNPSNIKTLLNTIRGRAETIARLLKSKEIKHISITNNDRIYNETVYINHACSDPVESIKNAFTNSNNENNTPDSQDISKAGESEYIIHTSY